MKKIVLLAIVILCVLNLMSCNTLRGMGKDIESLGESIQDASDK